MLPSLPNPHGYILIQTRFQSTCKSGGSPPPPHQPWKPLVVTHAHTHIQELKRSLELTGGLLVFTPLRVARMGFPCWNHSHRHVKKATVHFPRRKVVFLAIRGARAGPGSSCWTSFSLPVSLSLRLSPSPSLPLFLFPSSSLIPASAC